MQSLSMWLSTNRIPTMEVEEPAPLADAESEDWVDALEKLAL